MDHELSTLTLSPLTPYQFVVAGDGPYVRFSLLAADLTTLLKYLFLIRGICTTDEACVVLYNMNGAMFHVLEKA